jgi:hypothetical protein
MTRADAGPISIGDEVDFSASDGSRSRQNGDAFVRVISRGSNAPPSTVPPPGGLRRLP